MNPSEHHPGFKSTNRLESGSCGECENRYTLISGVICGLMPALFALTLLISGCSIFETRTAEPPDGGNVGVFLQPDRPEVVLDNLRSAVENLNTQNYLRSLDQDEFRFTPSNAALVTNPDLWVNWGYSEEQQYFNNMRAAAESTTGHQLTLQNITTELSSSTQRQIVGDYSLRIFHNRTNVGVPTSVSGRFVLELESGEDGLWRIISWTDVAVDGGVAWSDLRASFLVD